MSARALLLLSGLLLITTCAAYKPVIIIHGVWDSRFSLDFLTGKIREYHPGTDVHVIDILHGWFSLAPMWKQVEVFHAHMSPIMQNAPDGVILIGYSQGGLISRGILEAMDHNVKTFISLSSPQAGQYGDNFLRLIYPNFVKKTVYEVFYSMIGQKISVANYWNDPHEQELYFKYCNYLPYINNQINESYNKKYQLNFMKLKRLVLIGGPDDGVITPWQSSHFGFFDSEEKVIEMKNQYFYEEDLFGLRTLYEAGNVTIYEVPGVEHTQWHDNVSVIEKYIVPWLD